VTKPDSKLAKCQVHFSKFSSLNKILKVSFPKFLFDPTLDVPIKNACARNI